MAVSLCPVPKMQFLKDNGQPAAGYYLYTYAAGLPSTPKGTYTDSTATSFNSWPIPLDAAGRASIWLDGYYYMELWTALKAAPGASMVWSQDNVSGANYDVTNVNIVATHLDDIATVATNIDSVIGAAAIDEVYQRASATDPTTRIDGTALQNGDIYLNTNTNRVRAYANGVWYDTETLGATDAALVSYVNPTDGAAHAIARATDDRLSDIASILDYCGAPLTSINAAVLNAEGHVNELYFPMGVYHVDNNLTISCAVTMNAGAIFSIDSGKTLTINGAFSGSLTQHFTGSGTVVFGNGAVSCTYPEWWGAIGDGTTDDATALAAMFSSGASKFELGNGKTYKSTTAQVLSGALNLNGGGLKFVVSGSIKCLDMRSNSEVFNGTIENAGSAPSGDGSYQCPVLVGDYGVGTGYSNVVIRDLTVISNRANGNGIMITGNSHNIKIDNIVFPSSAYIGRCILAHWGNDPTPGTPPATTYHPFNINISNIKTGTLSYAPVGTNADNAVVFISGAYNIFVDNVVSDSCYQAARYYAGDYSTQSAGAVAAMLGHGIMFNNIIATTTDRGVNIKAATATNTYQHDCSISIRNCLFKGAYVSGTSADTTYGIALQYCSGIVIENNEITGYPSHGIIIGTNAKNIYVKNNTVYTVGHAGVHVNVGATTTGSYTIDSNRIYYTNNNSTSGSSLTRASISVDASTSVSIVNNYLGLDDATEAALYGIRFGSTATYCEINGNFITGSTTQTTGVSNSASTDYDLANTGSNNQFGSKVTTTNAGAPLCTIHSDGTRTIKVTTAAPTAGTWILGDRAVRTPPVVGQPKAWTVTVAGTPGTWTSEGNL